MSRRLPNYLRTFRKRAGLSQKDVALLLGCTYESKASQYEQFAREPTLATALSCEVLFGVPLSELFAGMYDDAYEAVLVRARSLAEELGNQSGPTQARKRQFLEAFVSRNPSHSKK
jgi:transcriptional regulator with XRE-family HTH domain